MSRSSGDKHTFGALDAKGVARLIQGCSDMALVLNMEGTILDVMIRGDDDAAIAGAVEELLRYLSIIHTGQRRVALEDIEIGGETIRAGDGIIIDLAPANWDGTVFPEPELLDLTRPARQHMAFGFGPHQCVGQQLARAEMVIAFRTLFRRIPTLRLAVGVDEIPFKNDRLAYGVYELPVTW